MKTIFNKGRRRRKREEGRGKRVSAVHWSITYRISIRRQRLKLKDKTTNCT